MRLLSLFAAVLIAPITRTCNGQVNPPTTPKTTTIEYQDGDAQLLGHLVVPEGKETNPAIVIIPYVHLLIMLFSLFPPDRGL